MIIDLLFLFQLFLIGWVSLVLVNLLVRYDLGSNSCEHFSRRHKELIDKIPGIEAELWEGTFRKGSFEEKMGIEKHVYLRLKVWFLGIPWEPLACAPFLPVLDSDIIKHEKKTD